MRYKEIRLCPESLPIFFLDGEKEKTWTGMSLTIMENKHHVLSYILEEKRRICKSMRCIKNFARSTRKTLTTMNLDGLWRLSERAREASEDTYFCLI